MSNLPPCPACGRSSLYGNAAMLMRPALSDAESLALVIGCSACGWLANSSAIEDSIALELDVLPPKKKPKVRPRRKRTNGADAT